MKFGVDMCHKDSHRLLMKYSLQIKFKCGDNVELLSLSDKCDVGILTRNNKKIAT